MSSITSQAFFAEAGLLATAVPGFKVRPAQVTMADAIEKTIALDSELVIEAGTGTGKTFGYLVPIFLAQKKTIIATGTKNLQDQLFFNDVPLIKQLIKKTLGYALKVVLLKGRANYLCLYRMERNLCEGRFTNRQMISELQMIREWSTVTTSGDTAELDAIPEDAAIWPYATSTVDNCLNQDCLFFKDCYVNKARKEALSADIVIVNHHLFFADIALQEQGFGELLPNVDVVIFDEAHQLPDIASYFFSRMLSSRQLIELARDCEAEANKSAQDMQQLIDLSLQLQRAVQGVKTALGLEIKAAMWPAIMPQSLEATIGHTKNILSDLAHILKESAVRSKELESCWRRCNELIEKLATMTNAPPDNTVQWYENHLQSFTLHLTPLVVAEYFNKFLSERKHSWIFTSATLTVNNNFSLFTETLGLQKALQLQLKSPFDYQKQALMYVPRGLPDVKASHYIEKIIEAAIPILMASGGKAFMLFTSHRALDLAAILLAEKIPFPILRQGTKSKRQLIDEFKLLGNAVLLGTSSFWYGVDVRGEALSCVIIDKLPFAAPDDPILKAKIHLFRQKGLDPFKEYQLPQAVLTLKQGAGRLIRDSNDRGVLMICDPRLVANRYGEVFLKSLPDMQRTRELKVVENFFSQTKTYM